MSVCNALNEYLLELLRCGLNGQVPCEKPEGVSWQALFSAARKHSVTSLAFQAVKRTASVVEPVVLSQWRDYNLIALAKYSAQVLELERLCDDFERLGTPYMPLKGSCIRRLYPQPAFREMADLDILIPKKRLSECEALLSKRGYVMQSRQSYHSEWERPPYMAVELHSALIPYESEFRPFFADPWKNTVCADGTHLTKQTLEDEYLYHLVHSAKHYFSGGTGIRSVLDVYIYKSAVGSELDNAYLCRMLEKMRLSEFANSIEELAEAWFSCPGKPLHEDTAQMAQLILTSSTFGSKGNYAVNTIRRYTQKGDSINRAKRRFFRSMLCPRYADMCWMFPVLQKVPVLLPACHLYRWGKLLVHKPGALIKKIIYINGIVKDKQRAGK